MLVALCGAAILGLGGDSFAADETSRFLGPALRWIFSDWTPEQHASGLFLVRKLAHLTEYGLFGALAFRALTLSFSAAPIRLAALGLMMVLGLAAFDEGRQSRLDSRTGSGLDILIDLAGGAAALAGLLALQRRLGRPLFSHPENGGEENAEHEPR